MSIRMQQLKKYIDAGSLQLARLDENSKPVKMQFTQLETQTNSLNTHQRLYQLVSTLSWQQKYQWVNTRRLKGNQLFKTGSIQKAIQCYVQSLIGLELVDGDEQRNKQVKFQLQFPILMNIATCFYKLKQYQKGVEICQQVLNDPMGMEHLQALYKKAYFLYELGDFVTAKQLISHQGRDILLKLNSKLDKTTNKKLSKQDVKQLLAKIIAKTKEEKIIYKKIFYQQDDDVQSSTDSQIQQPVFEYHENFLKKSIIWLKETLESCYKYKSSTYIPTMEEQSSNLLNKRYR